jgi:hypothetical protein
VILNGSFISAMIYWGQQAGEKKACFIGFSMFFQLNSYFRQATLGNAI